MIRFGEMTRGRVVRHRRRRAERRAHREPERDRSARHPEALRPGQSRRRAVAQIARVESADLGRTGGSMNTRQHKWPAIHNAMWPGLVGKGPDSEPPIDLDTMLDLTAGAASNGIEVRRRRSVSVRPARQHRLRPTTISSGCATRSRRADSWSARWSRRCGRRPAAARRWASDDDRKNFLTQVRKACAIGKKLRDLGVRTYGVVRIDSASSPAEWAKDPEGNTKKIAETFREACDVAEELRRAAGRRRRNLLGRHAQLEAHGRSCSRW